MKTKNPLVAALLSIVLPGAGLLYTGAAALGYLFILISIGLALSPHWVANSYSTIYLVGVIYLIWLATSAVLAAIRAKKSNSRGEISSNPWVILIVALVVDFGTYTWVTKPDFGPLKIVTMTNNSLSPLLYNREQLVVNTKVEIERGDLVGVYYPKPFFDLSVDVDRVIGYPGEVIELKNNLCYVNGNLTEPYENLRYTITISVATGTDIDFEFWNKYGLDGVGPRPGGYIITSTEATAEQIVNENDWALGYNIRQADSAVSNPRLFTGAIPSWNENQLGPITIPSAGMTIPLDSANRILYKRTLLLEDSNIIWTDTAIIRNGQPIEEYTFKEDSFWLMADNRDNGFDSRLWGFVPESFLIGKAMYIWEGFEDERRGASLQLD